MAMKPTINQPAVQLSICPHFHHAVELIGRRWTGAILRALLDGATRFSQIEAAVPGLSDRLLTERLRELEAEGIVTRTVIPSMPVRVEYGLTQKGRDLEAPLGAIAAWAEAWVPAGEVDDGRGIAERGCDEDDRLCPAG